MLPLGYCTSQLGDHKGGLHIGNSCWNQEISHVCKRVRIEWGLDKMPLHMTMALKGDNYFITLLVDSLWIATLGSLLHSYPQHAVSVCRHCKPSSYCCNKSTLIMIKTCNIPETICVDIVSRMCVKVLMLKSVSTNVQVFFLLRRMDIFAKFFSVLQREITFEN